MVTEEVKIKKPLPIFVSDVEEIQLLLNVLMEKTPRMFILKCLDNNEGKIQPKTVDAYSKIFTALTEKKTKFHTYRLKSNKTFKVVVRGLHSATPINEIHEALKEFGHKVIHVSNIRSKDRKTKLSLFNVELSVQSNNKEIYDIKGLLYTKVTVEPPHRKRKIPKCANRQRFEHTERLLLPWP